MYSKKTALYRHYDINGNLLYIGISLSAINRLSQHKNTSEWFNSIAKVDIEWFNDRESAILAEMEAVRLENPKFNIFLKDRKPHTKRLKKKYKQNIYTILDTGKKQQLNVKGGIEVSDNNYQQGEAFICLTPELLSAIRNNRKNQDSLLDYFYALEKMAT